MRRRGMDLDSAQQPPHKVALARRERIGVDRLGIY